MKREPYEKGAVCLMKREPTPTAAAQNNTCARGLLKKKEIAGGVVAAFNGRGQNTHTHKHSMKKAHTHRGKRKHRELGDGSVPPWPLSVACAKVFGNDDLVLNMFALVNVCKPFVWMGMQSKSMYHNIWGNFELVRLMMVRWDPRQTMGAYYRLANEARAPSQE